MLTRNLLTPFLFFDQHIEVDPKETKRLLIPRGCTPAAPGHHPHHEIRTQEKAVMTMNQNTLSIGIDLSLKSNHVVVLDGEGKQLTSFSTGNDLPGAKGLVEKILALAATHQASTVRIGMEATSLYWWHLHQFLIQDETLHSNLSVSVFTLNPKLVHRFHQGMDDLDKSDPVDAMVIAEKVRVGRLKPSHLIDERYEPLKRLTRFRYHLVHSMIAEQNYFLTHLFLKYSSWQKVKPFSSAFGVTAEELIREYDAEALIGSSVSDLAEKLIALSHGRLADAQKTVRLIKQVANDSYPLNVKFKEPIDLILANTYDNVRYFQGKVKALDTIIEKELSRFHNPLTSIKGIGLVFAAGITAELADPSRFSNQSAIGKYAGLAWRKHQSGEFDAQETPRKPGNSFLRYYLVAAANSLRVHNEKYKQYYQRKFQEVPKHQHKRALVLTARKLARLCFAMLRDQRLYQPGYQKGVNPYPD